MMVRKSQLSSKQIVLALTTAALILALATMGISPSPVRAQDGATPAVTQDGSGDTPVTITLTGTVQTVTPQSDGTSLVTLDDGSTFIINSATTGAEGIAPGQTVTVVAVVGDNSFTAQSVAPADDDTEATPVATDVATPVGTPAATQVATQVTDCVGTDAHPVATRMAEALGVSYDEVMGYKCSGYGFGEIAKAYLLAEKTGQSVDDILALRAAGQGWGQIFKDAGVKLKKMSVGQLIHGKKIKSDDTEDDDDSASAQSDDDKGGNGKGNGNGNGNGNNNNGNGNGNGKGNGNSNGKGKGKNGK